MRLTQEESERNRKQILEVAGRLFRQRGFDGVGVDDLLGLTRLLRVAWNESGSPRSG